MCAKKTLSKPDIQSFFNKQAYLRDNCENFLIAFSALNKKKDVVGILPRKDNLYLLDMGCGTGTFEEVLIDQYNLKFFAIGVDISQTELKIAKNKKKLNVCDFLNSDAASLPFKDNSFDCCVLVDVIEHIPDKEKTFGEIWRVLKKDGVLIMTTPNKNDLVLKIHNTITAFGLGLFRRQVPHKDDYVSLNDLNYLLHKTRFQIDMGTIKYLVPLVLTVYGKTWGVIPPLPPNKIFSLFKYLLKLENNHRIPVIIPKYFAWTIFVYAKKKI